MNLTLPDWLPNALGFQAFWCLAVGGAAQGWWWLGPLALAAFAGCQLTVSRERRADLELMLIAAALGFAIDSLWVQSGWIAFRSPLPSNAFAPIWIVAMWMGFALTLNHSLAVLRQRPWLAALLGLIGGPVAYWIAAHGWQAARIDDGPWPWLALALAWGLVTPMLAGMARRMTATHAPAGA